MKDGELLKLAASAAGIADGDVLYDMENDKEWNPLTDDGDALRLAVRLNLSVFTPGGDCGDFAVASIDDGVLSDDGDTWVQEWVKNGDKLAATRRAIVRAAAEIGKATINPLTPKDPK